MRSAPPGARRNRPTAGHIVAETVAAPESVPRFTNSAMDGYAVKAADTASGQKSHMLRSMAQANALALLPDGGVRAGERVEVLVLDDEALGSTDLITGC